MRLLILNPNSTRSMTDRIAAEASQYIAGDVNLTALTNYDGPASIQGAQDGDAALPGTLYQLDQTPFDAAIIGCFDDTGLRETSQKQGQMVVGLGEAAMRTAAGRREKFAVLTTSTLSVPVLEANAQAYGLTENLVCVRASAIDVLDFETDRDAACQRLITAGRTLLSDHPEIETIVLGCAGMGGLAEQMARELSVVVIDPIRAAIDTVIRQSEVAR